MINNIKIFLILLMFCPMLLLGQTYKSNYFVTAKINQFTEKSTFDPPTEKVSYIKISTDYVTINLLDSIFTLPIIDIIFLENRIDYILGHYKDFTLILAKQINKFVLSFIYVNKVESSFIMFEEITRIN